MANSQSRNNDLSRQFLKREMELESENKLLRSEN